MSHEIEERCDIGECLPINETVEECKARFRRIVDKQKKCYESCGKPCPRWLDADFLYRINYGPGTRVDAITTWKILQPIILHKRRRLQVTLLDRRIVHELYKAVFKKGTNIPILHCDWDDSKEAKERCTNPSPELTTPFDYLSHTVDTAVYRWCEEFVVQYVWRVDYSSSLFGNNTRPPMAAVAFDMVLLVRYLASLPRYPERSLAKCFAKFLSRHKHKLQSISIGPNFDYDWACQGYIWDLFNMIILDNLSENGLDKYNPGRQTGQDEARYINVSWVKHAKFPGGDIIGVESAIDRHHLKALYGSLAEMRASHIHSGPFRLALTPHLSDHLTMKDRKILIYCDKPSKARRDRGHIPGAGYYGPYTRHTLGRLMDVDTILTEIAYSYSVLFSRDDKSKAIARALFADPEYRLAPLFCHFHDMTTVVRPGNVIILDWESSFKAGRDPTLGMFEQYKGHFALLQQQMENWKPEKRGDLLRPGYKDRFLWYTTIFGLVIASLGIISIITSIISAATGIVQMNASLAALKQQPTTI